MMSNRLRQRRLAIRENRMNTACRVATHTPRRSLPPFHIVWHGNEDHIIRAELNDTIPILNRIYPRLKINPAFLAMDKISGVAGTSDIRKLKPGEFPLGSIFREEGQLLYAMVRALNPKRIMEIGTYYGCSTTHMASALQDSNSKAKIYAIDNGFDAIQCGFDSGNCATIGMLIPPQYKSFVDLHIANLEDELIKFKDDSVDFIFEDSLHTYYTTHYISEQSKRILRPGGFLVVHDILHPYHGMYSDLTVADDMQNAFRDTGLLDNFYAVLIGKSTTGLGIWQKPKTKN